MSEWEFIAPMIIGATFIIATAGVILLRPLTKRLGIILEQMQRDRQTRIEHAELVKIAERMERLETRMEGLEERQEFTDRLLESGALGAASRRKTPQDARG